MYFIEWYTVKLKFSKNILKTYAYKKLRLLANLFTHFHAYFGGWFGGISTISPVNLRTSGNITKTTG